MPENKVGAEVRIDMAGYDTGHGRIGAGMSVSGTITHIDASGITARLRAPVDGQDTVTVPESKVTAVTRPYR